ncbi:MAG: flotillin-like protein FloA [Gemmataceae bacterium]|nr:flotillin-like protein FloA [Gemmataceae bacterium]
MSHTLLAALDLGGILLIGGGVLAAIIVLVLLFILGNFMGLYIKAWVTKANVGFTDMIRMQLSNIDYRLVVNEKIKLTNAGIPIDIRELEQHVLTKGNLVRTVAGVINAKKASIELPWKTAAAIDLAGRDILEAVRWSVIPKVIDCPDPSKGRLTLDGVCKNGIQLKARARVTVRTKLERLVGGAGEETIIARVGEGIVKAIGSAENHKDIMANPNLISQAVLNNSLDSQTAFEIVSIDVAEIDVGANVGANLQAEQAAADLRVAQAQAETRRANAVAQAQENAAKVEENRALLVLAESDVPKAIAHAIRDGKMGVMDYYNLQNLQSDTGMRSAIAGIGGKGGQTPQG